MEPSGVTIRPLELADVDEVVAACEWLFAPPSSVPGDWDPAVAAERLRRLHDDQRSTAYVAVLDGAIDGTIAGFCTVYLDLESLRFGQRAWLNELAVDPRHRSRGLGRQLLHTARDWAASQGATLFMLDSSTARTDAHRFYRREEPSFEAVCFGWRL